MNLDSTADWLAWAALAMPLAALAWSAVQYILIQKKAEQQRRFDNLFRVMEMVGMRDGSLAAKAAAVYELRNYPEYKDVIVRFCREAEGYVGGDAAQILKTEFNLTVAHFEND